MKWLYIFSLLLGILNPLITERITIDSNDRIIIPYNTPTTTQQILESYCLKEQLSVEKMELQQDTFQNQYQKIGTYKICFNYYLTPKQFFSKILFVQVIDQEPPVIQLKYGKEIIADHHLSLEEIKKYFIFNDNHQINEQSFQIEKNTYNGTKDTPFELTISIEDKSGNKSTFTTTYIITDTNNRIMVRNVIISNDTTLSNEELLALKTNTTNDHFGIPIIHLVDIMAPLSLEQIKSHYLPEEHIKLETNYEPDFCQIGQYSLIVAYHLEYYTIYFEDIILVRDFKPPIIKPKELEITIDLCQLPDDEYFYKLFDIEDYQVDSVVLQLTAVQQSSNTYLLTCTATNSSYNQASATILCHTFSSIQEVILPLTIDITKNTYNENEILAFFLEKYSLPSGYEKLSLKSNYYLNKNGIYRCAITVDYQDGSKITYIFKLNLFNEKEKEESQSYLYWSLAILGLFFLIGIIIYYKRSNS